MSLPRLLGGSTVKSKIAIAIENHTYHSVFCKPQRYLSWLRGRRKRRQEKRDLTANNEGQKTNKVQD